MVLVVWVVEEVLCPDPLGLVYERPLLRLTEQLPLAPWVQGGVQGSGTMGAGSRHSTASPT